MKEDLSRFCCQNADAPTTASGGRQPDGLRPLRQDQQHRLLYCRTCKARFSERKGTPLFGSQLTEDKAVELRAPRRAQRRAGHRAVDRVNRNTVVRYSRLRATTPGNSTTSSWLFPPQTREVQFDEKWSYVFKKQEHCDPDDPADEHRGDWWDHVAYDPEHRLVLGVVPGARDAEAVEEVVAEVKQRTEGRCLRLVTSDDYPAYETAILHVYGEEVTTTPRAEPAGGWSPRRCRRRG